MGENGFRRIDAWVDSKNENKKHLIETIKKALKNRGTDGVVLDEKDVQDLMEELKRLEREQ